MCIAKNKIWISYIQIALAIHNFEAFWNVRMKLTSTDILGVVETISHFAIKYVVYLKTLTSYTWSVILK
jgi:hypothetical protein